MRILSFFILAGAVSISLGAPSLQSISPSEYTQGTTATVSITGLSTDFGLPMEWSGTTVWQNNVDSVIFTRQKDTLRAEMIYPTSSTILMATINVAKDFPLGLYDLSLVQKEPRAKMALQAALTITSPPPPAITGVTPAGGKQGVPLTVTITGLSTDFGAIQLSGTTAYSLNVDSVYLLKGIGAIHASSFIALTPNSLAVTFYPKATDAAGVYDLVVRQHSPNVRLAAPAIFTLEQYVQPSISSVPQTVEPGNPFSLEITGSNTAFALPFLTTYGTTQWDNNVDSVYLSRGGNLVSTSQWTASDASHLRVQFDAFQALTPGSYSLTVIQKNPRVRIMLAGALNVVTPQLTGMKPDSGRQAEKISVTITGLATNFGNPQQFSPTMGNVTSVFLYNSNRDTIFANTWRAYGLDSDTVLPASFIPNYSHDVGRYNLVVVQRTPSLRLEKPGAFIVLQGTKPELQISPDSGMSNSRVTCWINGAFEVNWGVLPYLRIDSIVLQGRSIRVKAQNFGLPSVINGTNAPDKALVTFLIPGGNRKDTCDIKMYTTRGILSAQKTFRIYPEREPVITAKQEKCASRGRELRLLIESRNVSISTIGRGEYDFYIAPDFDISITKGNTSLALYPYNCTDFSHCTAWADVPGNFPLGWCSVTIKTKYPEKTFILPNAVYIATRDSCYIDSLKTPVAFNPETNKSPVDRPAIFACGKRIVINPSALGSGNELRILDTKGRIRETYLFHTVGTINAISRPAGVYFIHLQGKSLKKVFRIVIP